MTKNLTRAKCRYYLFLKECYEYICIDRSEKEGTKKQYQNKRILYFNMMCFNVTLVLSFKLYKM